MEQIAKQLTFLDLPSPLWALHIHQNYDFLSILHIKVTQEKIVVDKGIILTEEMNNLNNLCVKIFLNGYVSKIPNVTFDVTACDLLTLLNILHSRNVCCNASDSKQYPNCLKLVENDKYGSESNGLQYCDECRNSNEQKIFLEGCNILQPPAKELSLEDLTKSIKYEEIHNDLISETTESGQFKNKIEPEMITNNEEDKDHCGDNKGLCNICGKTFSSRYRMKEHLVTHSSEKKFQCHICNRGFSRSFNLKMHEHTHTGNRPYICEACGKSYKTGSNLKMHALSCHKESKPYVCDICQMTFVYPRYLKLHMRKHTGERPYKCNVCEKKFAKNIHLTVHMRTHTGEKPYCCTFCGKCFTTTGGLGSHQKSHHQVN